MKIICFVLTFSVNWIVARPNNNNDLKNQLMNCSTCKSPTFHGRDFYLPFCSNGETFPDLCEAVCSNSEVTPSKG